MAIPHVTKVYAISDCRVSKLTADPAGGAAAYAASVDVVGVKKMVITGAVQSKQLRGDNTLLDADATLMGLSAVIDYAKQNTDLLNILLGGAVADSGSTPNQVSTFRLLGGAPPLAPSLPNFFKVEAKGVDVDYVAGDCHIVLWKCKIDSFPDLGFNEEDYQIYKFGVQSMPRVSDGFWMDVIYDETAVAIV
jgi:hypothetical protein